MGEILQVLRLVDLVESGRYIVTVLQDDFVDARIDSGHYIVIVKPVAKAPLAKRHEVEIIDRRTGKRAGSAWLTFPEDRTRPPLRRMVEHAIYYHDRMAAPRRAGVVFVRDGDGEETYGDPR